MTGRPSVYDPQRAERLLSAIAGGASIREACELVGYPLSTVAMWAVNNRPENFRAKYFSAFAARSLIDLDDARAGLVEVANSNSMPQVQARRSIAELARFQATKLISELGERIQIASTPAQINIFLPAKDGQPGDGARVIEGQAVEQIEPVAEPGRYRPPRVRREP